MCQVSSAWKKFLPVHLLNFLPFLFFEGGLCVFYNLQNSFRVDCQFSRCIHHCEIVTWGFKPLSCRVLRLPLRFAVSRATGTVPRLWELFARLCCCSFFIWFIPSNSASVADFEPLNSFAPGLYILIDKFAFTYGQIMLYLEKIFLLCVLFHWTFQC